MVVKKPECSFAGIKLHVLADLSVTSMGVARIFQRGGHTVSNRGYSRFRNLNIVGCLSKKRLTKGGVTGTPGPPLATPLVTSSDALPLSSRLMRALGHYI